MRRSEEKEKRNRERAGAKGGKVKYEEICRQQGREKRAATTVLQRAHKLDSKLASAEYKKERVEGCLDTATPETEKQTGTRERESERTR